MKGPIALLLLAVLAACSGPTPPAVDTAVLQPPVACRASHYGTPTLAERGIGGTGAPSRMQVADRGIGGTGIVGIVTGFASVCVDGLEVRLDKSVPVSINGRAMTTGQLRVGQMVIINATGPLASRESVPQARKITVRYEVSGPIEAVDIRSGSIRVAGQAVMVLPTTWMAGRFGIGDWTSVSGLRQPDGTIIASRLDRARIGALFVRGQVVREHGTIRIGSLVLHGPAASGTVAGTFVTVAGGYQNQVAEVTSIDMDVWAEDPADYFGLSTRQLIVQGFVRVAHGMVWLSNGGKFPAGPGVQANAGAYRDAVVWLKRTTDGSFAATDVYYTNYRAQPKVVPANGKHGAGGPVPPPDLPPPLPAADSQPADAVPGAPTDLDPEVSSPQPDDDATGIIAPPSPADVPPSTAAPTKTQSPADGAFVADGRSVLPFVTGPAMLMATAE
ncbi:DUF5666 domain-containing protein [Acidisphaera sp. S103]|uniref:DUF5666 domain-containing protein n=1 Tax=Acidisphaera sp. S103 TaxID=1747223 RepID=UPI00131B130B|nr:DUF5666 domain-containing protein [Acidisphaera sp. S103]